MLGKSIRMERVMNCNTHNAVIIPLTHRVGMRPIEGINLPPSWAEKRVLIIKLNEEVYDDRQRDQA